MDEIRALPWNGYNAVSTFSGCGGSSTGYRMAGFKVRWASEFIPAAQDSYRANMAPYTVLDTRDIRKVQPEDILRASGLDKGEIDLFDGSPPCAAFSTAGKREAGWGKVKKYSDTEQRVDDLFHEFARLVKGTQPRVFIAENVSGLVKGTAKGYFLEILAALKACGYRVSAKVLDAQWLGVPQARQRLIFCGVREDLRGVDGKPLQPAHPAPLTYQYTVGEALNIGQARVIHDTGGQPQYSGGDITDRPSVTVLQDRPHSFSVETEDFIADDLFIDNEVLGKPTWGSLSHAHPTIMASGPHSVSGHLRNSKTLQRRKFTIAELKRICGFPDDYILTGTYAQQWERCGRAVPPVMMSYIAATAKGILDAARAGDQARAA